MSIFKTGLVMTASACALAIIAGHGHLGLGFGRLGYDAQATVEFVTPVLSSTFDVVGSAIRSGSHTAQHGLGATTAAAKNIAQAATQAAAHGSVSARAIGARYEQSDFRSELYGPSASHITPSTEQLSEHASRLSAQKFTSGAAAGRQAALEATAENLLRDNAGLRALSFPNARRIALPGSALATARAASIQAFSQAFARTLNVSPSTPPPLLWPLPGTDTGLSKPEGYPIAAALAAAIEASHSAKSHATFVSQAPCPSWALDSTPTLDRKTLSAQALALGGQARLFVAARAGAQPAEISVIVSKLNLRRAVLSSTDLPTTEPWPPSLGL